MSGYMVRVIDPAQRGKPYPHARCFFDHAESVSLALHDAGLRGKRQIILGANLLPIFPEPIPDDAILYNLEVSSSPWMTEAYLDLLRQRPVLDYSEANVGWLKARGVDARWCPIRYHPHLTRLKLLPEAERSIDILFYGGFTPRRAQILAAIETYAAPPWRCKWIQHDQWNERDDAIKRSKIVVNIHAYDNAPLEMARISYLLANKCFVLSEGPVDPTFRSMVAFAKAEDIPTQCHLWLGNQWGRTTLAEHGYQAFSRMDQQSALLTALEGL